MPGLAFILLLAFLPAETESGRYNSKAAISSPVVGPQQVYGLLNGSVTVKCFYPPTSVNRHDRKYWCRESATGCTTVVSTSGYVARGYQGRVSITNYPQAEHFQINISALRAADTGTYQCGIGINGRGLSHKVSLEVSEGPHIPEGAELFYVRLHSTVTMSCSFGEGSASMRKFLCKMEKNGCRNIIDSSGDVDKNYVGRVLLSHEEVRGSFSIVMSQVGWEDSGLYLCGVGFYGEEGETKQLDVHVYEEANTAQRTLTVTAVKGGSATFLYNYAPLKRSSEKYWCKWRKNGCSQIIGTSGFVMGLYEGRVALYDNPVNSTVTIILNQLKESDEGYYWFMTDEEQEQQTSAELKIIDGEPGLQGKKKVEAQVGSRVDLTCSYGCKYYSYQKYWCKWSSTSCTPMLATDQRQPGPDVTCDTDNKTVILSFDSVAKSDEGWYWCGVKRNGLLGETMAVYLWVTEDAGSSTNHNLDADPELLDVVPPGHTRSGFSPQGRASNDAGVPNAAASESSEQSHGPNALVLSLSCAGAALLILVIALAVFKYRQLKRSDLVSVGSYRTNISMSDFESVKEYSATNNACVQETQETQIGGDEFVTDAAPPESTAETKKAKRRSKEDADLAYSTFLLTCSNKAQGGSGGDSAAPAVAPPTWEDQI